ncbi:MAG: YkgJ family cysteine cluster protein [Deltaproteobacteria bacterium]|nr:YkgJ family cysteine cluster protein [Deltaproteobacteria bacterium]
MTSPAAPPDALRPLDGPPDPDGADCVACGRCCHHGPRTVHLREADERRLTAEQLAGLTETLGPAGFRFLRSVEGACIALDRSTPGRYPCRIYERRPDDCREVAPGSEWCLAARRVGRLVPLPAR